MNDEVVRRAMAQLAAESPPPLPDAARIWWLAEFGRRQQKRQQVARTMILTRVFTSAAVVLGACGVAVWWGVDLPSLEYLTVAALVCAGAAGARAMLAAEE
jgi:hypothetical protein